MQIRFYLNPETGELHIHGHAVVESEVAEAFANVLEDGGGEGGARVAIGRTDAGRYIRIIYSPTPSPSRSSSSPPTTSAPRRCGRSDVD